MPADGFASLTLEVDRCGVEEHDVQIGEQVTTPSKQCFLDEVLVGAGSKGRGSVLLGTGNNLSQPGHGPVKVVQVQIGDPFDRVVVLPLLGGTIASRCKEPMQHGEEDGSFNGELKAPAFEQGGQDLVDRAGLPEPFKDGVFGTTGRKVRLRFLGSLGSQNPINGCFADAEL